MTPKIKKIIAREGLVTVGCFTFVYILTMASRLFVDYHTALWNEQTLEAYKLKTILLKTIYLYLPIRFIAWAVKTVRGK